MGFRFILFLFTITIEVSHVNGQLESERFMRLKNREIVAGTTLTASGVLGRFRCCNECLRNTYCSAVSINKSSGQCVLLLDLLCEGYHLGTSLETNVYYKERQGGWYLAFRGTAGVGVPLIYTYEGTFNTGNPNECRNIASKTCTTHYRDPMLNIWYCFNITQAKMELYTNGTSVAMIKFNAEGSDYLSWFSEDRILEHTWGTLDAGVYYKFSIKGTGRRTFYIGQHYGCGSDAGYSMALDTVHMITCGYEDIGSFPRFIYAKTPSITEWGYETYGLADTLAVYVKIL